MVGRQKGVISNNGFQFSTVGPYYNIPTVTSSTKIGTKWEVHTVLPVAKTINYKVVIKTSNNSIALMMEQAT